MKIIILFLLILNFEILSAADLDFCIASKYDISELKKQYFDHVYDTVYVTYCFPITDDSLFLKSPFVKRIGSILNEEEIEIQYFIKGRNFDYEEIEKADSLVNNTLQDFKLYKNEIPYMFYSKKMYPYFNSHGEKMLFVLFKIISEFDGYVDTKRILDGSLFGFIFDSYSPMKFAAKINLSNGETHITFGRSFAW